MSTRAYRLPDLLSMLPEKPAGLNPYFKEADAIFNAWVRKFLTGSSAMEAENCETPLSVALVWPLASHEQLQGIISWIAASFLMDDLMERCPKEHALTLAHMWSNLFRDKGAIDQPLMTMIQNELMPSMKAAFDSFYWPQMVAESEKMAFHMAQEALDREAQKNTVSTVQSFLVRRRLVLGAVPCFVMTRCTRRLYIPDDVLHHPVVQDMENAMMDILSISNDIYSFKKEHKFNKAFDNILTVIQKDREAPHLDFQGVIDHAGKLFEAALERFHACTRRLPSVNPEVDQYLDSYVDGLIDMAIGNIQWSLVTRRYNLFADEEDRKNNVVRLAL